MTHIMKKFSIVLIAVMFSAFAAAEGKVAVFNMQAAIVNTDMAKKRLQSLDASPDFAAMKAKFESLRSDLVSMEKDAQTNGMTWTAQQKAEQRKKAEYKSADLKLAAEKLKAERNEVLQQIMQEMAPKAKDALESIVKSGDYSLVLDSSVAYWADKGYDITPEVTKKLNKSK